MKGWIEPRELLYLPVRGLPLKLFACAVLYTLLVELAAQLAHDPSIRRASIRTFLPTVWAGAAALHWLFLPRPRPTPGSIITEWRVAFRRRPGLFVWWVGSATSVMVLAATKGLNFAERDIRIWEIAVAVVVVVAVTASFTLRQRSGR